MKDTFYFPHDYHARNNLKIEALLSDHGPSAYGIFWMIIEILHENEDHSITIINGSYKALAKQMSTSVEHIEAVLKSCIEYELLYQDEVGVIRSDRVDKNIDARIEISKKRSKAGKISAEKRQNATCDEQSSTGVEQVSTKERKGKERKENNIYTADFLQFWEAYPKKKNKDDAFKAWKQKKQKPAIDEILSKLSMQKKCEDWKKESGKYIPYPATYINRGGWFDEVVVTDGIYRPKFTF